MERKQSEPDKEKVEMSKISHRQYSHTESEKNDDMIICNQSLLKKRKRNYEDKKKDLFRKVFREQLMEQFNKSCSDEHLCYESNGDLQPPEFVNDLLRSTSSLDSKGISRLRRKEI